MGRDTSGNPVGKRAEKADGPGRVRVVWLRRECAGPPKPPRPPLLCWEGLSEAPADGGRV